MKNPFKDDHATYGIIGNAAVYWLLMVWMWQIMYISIFGIFFLIASFFNINGNWSQETNNIIGYISGILTFIIGTFIIVIQIRAFRKEYVKM